MLKRFVKYRFLRILLRCLLGLVIFFVLLVLCIRSPWGQSIIVGKVVDYIADKTQTEVSIDKLFLTFSGNLELDGLYLEDQQGDTLLYSESLEVSVALMPLVRSQNISVKGLYWQGLKARVKRPSEDAPFNYEFLVDAFTPEETTVKENPDAQPSPPLNLGLVNLKQFDVQYSDALTGMEVVLILGQLELLPGKTDLNQMDFSVERLAIADTKVSYELLKSNSSTSDQPPVSSKSQETLTPRISVNALVLDNISLEYQSIPDDTEAKVDLGSLELKRQKIDLSSQVVSLDELTLDNSDVFLKLLPQQTAPLTDSTQTSEPLVFDWPDWQVDIKKIALNNNSYEIQQADSVLKPNVFDPGHIDLSNAYLTLNNILYKPGRASLELDQLAFKERSGFTLRELGLQVLLTEESLSINNLQVVTLSNFLSGTTTLDFASLQELINTPTSIGAALKLDSLYINPEEFLPFSPDLMANEPIRLFTQKPLTGKLNLSGSEEAIEVADIALKWGKNTHLDLKGTIEEPMDTSRIFVNLTSLEVQSDSSDIATLMMGQDPGVKIPGNVRLTGSFEGGLTKGKTDLKVNSSLGSVDLGAEFTRAEDISVMARIHVQDLLLQKLLSNEQLDTLSVTMNLQGNGSSLNDLTAKLKTDFQKLRFNGYDYSALKLEADINEGQGLIDLSFKDRNLDMALQTQLLLDTVAPKAESVLTLNGIDLKAMGFTKEPIRTAFTISTEVAGNSDDLRASLRLRNGRAVYEQEPYTFGDFDLQARATKDTLIALLNSRFIDASVLSNRNIDQLIPALQQQFDYYLNQSPPEGNSVDDGTILQASVSLRSTPVLTEVFVQPLERLDTVTIKFNFDQTDRLLQASLLAPHITYLGNEIDSVKVDLNGDETGLDMRAGWSEIKSGAVAVDEGLFTGLLQEGALDSRFTIYNDTSKFFSIGSALVLGDTLSLHVSEKDLIFNQRPWSVLDGNQLTITSETVDVTDFELTNGVQKLILSDEMPGSERAHIAAIFENFQLTNLIGFLNPGKPLAKGTINGSFTVEEPLGVPGLLADLSILNIKTMDVPIGNLTLSAHALGGKEYDIDLAVKGEEIDLKMAGEYQNSDLNSQLDIRLDINSLQTSLIEKFATDQLKNARGNISGAFSIKGNSDVPVYQGLLDFNKTGFFVNQLNTSFSMDQEQIRIDNEGLHLKAFTIADGDQNTFDIDGNILTEEITNPTFDLKLTARSFTPINSTREDSDFFYGQVSVNTDLDITGDLQIPKVRGKVQVNEGSAVTIIVPESQLELKAREGVVVFVNRKNPDDILTREPENEPTALGQMLAGFDIETILEIGRNTEFNIIIDEQRGDNLKVKGTGSFNMGLEPNGRTRLSGRYSVTGGHLEVGLYGLVGRKFELVPGSTINWLGDPLDAKLDMRALYRLNVSAGPLMAERTTSNADIEAAYRQKLPFEVYINVAGELLQPEITFNIDMPEDERGALGGSVYSQIEQLNAQEDELTKQVFSLLVLGNFNASRGSDGSSGGPASLAIDNVSRLLEGQLSNYSDKLYDKTGLQLGVGINNRTVRDGSRSTSLDISAQKELFNDRLIIRVGSEVDVAGGQGTTQGTPIIGNVSVEYLITPDRRFRLRGFNRNSFEGVIDGQLTVSGIALIFSREFNKFKELWVRQLKEEKKKNRKPKKK